MEDVAKATKYWSKKSPATKWDYIVIGSGMGGMTTAAMLARFGKKVLVIEQHYVPGGFTHMFNRPGFTWDVGVHAVGEVTSRSLTGRILAELTEGRLQWAPLGPVYDQFHMPGGFHIDFPDNPRQFRDNLVAAFPDEVTGIDAYFAKVKEVAGGMRGYYLARTLPDRLAGLGERLLAGKAQTAFEQSTREVIAGLTKNEKLRTILVGQWGYYGSPPSRSSFAIQALVAKHFFHGGYYPVGGAKQIASELLRTVADAGGWTRIATSVDQILLENGRVAGVRLTSGEEIRAPRVVSAAGIASTLQRLLPPASQETAWAKAVTSLPPAPAHVCLYLGFKGDIRQGGAGPANQWFCNTWDAEQESWDISDPDRLPKAPVLYCSFPSLKDPTHDPGPKMHHTGEVVTFVPWKQFEPWLGTRWKKRGPEYDAFKKKLQDNLLEQFFSWMPKLAPMLDHVELSTPLSTDNFARPMAGSIYGIEPTPERFRNPWLKPRSPIPGLFFSGSEVATVGVIGAMMGGVLAATAAEPVKAIRYLRRVG